MNRRVSYGIRVLSCAVVISGYLNAATITVNGTDIKQIIKSPDQAVAVKVPDRINMCFRLKQGTIDIGGVSSTGLADFKKRRDVLEKNQSDMQQISLRQAFSSTAKTSMDLFNVWITAPEKTELRAGTYIDFDNVIINSKEVILECKKLQTLFCFIDADVLYIESSCPSSLVRSIRITFSRDVGVSRCIQGKIDFESNETEEFFFAVGAQEISLMFSPEVFK
jgi:hypothetical protein